MKTSDTKAFIESEQYGKKKKKVILSSKPKTKGKKKK